MMAVVVTVMGSSADALDGVLFISYSREIYGNRSDQDDLQQNGRQRWISVQGYENWSKWLLNTDQDSLPYWLETYHPLMKAHDVS